MSTIDIRIKTATPQNTTVGTSSAEAVAANEGRVLLVLCNDSDTAIYISFGTTAVLNKGIRLAPAGSADSRYTVEGWYKGAINAISSAGSKVLAYLENDDI